jgi:hypothetical protein
MTLTKDFACLQCKWMIPASYGRILISLDKKTKSTTIAGQSIIFEPKVVIFNARNTNIYKICELHRAIFGLSFSVLALIKNYSIAGIINFIQHGENLFVL